MPVSLCHLVLSSRVITTPPPYSRVMTVKRNGVKNLSGGAEPDKSSPTTGLRKKRKSAGVILGSFNIVVFGWIRLSYFLIFCHVNEFVEI